MNTSLFSESPRQRPTSVGDSFAEAAGYWERRRVWYNAALAILVLGWLSGPTSHSRPAFTMETGARLTIVACLANLCYCAVYLIDIPLSRSSLKVVWQRRRGMLWIGGTLFAIAVAMYWIADALYPTFG